MRTLIASPEYDGNADRRQVPGDTHHVADLLPFFVVGTLDQTERSHVLDHLDACAACRETWQAWESITEATRMLSAGPSRSSRLPPVVRAAIAAGAPRQPTVPVYTPHRHRADSSLPQPVIQGDRPPNQSPPDFQMFSPREREVLCLIASGRNDREIADDLGIAVRTVTTLVTRVLQKLTSAGWNRTSAAAYAIEHGLCDPDLPQPTLPPLSERERQVLCLIAEGLTNRGIAEQMGLKAITINTFVASIFGKLGVDNRAAAAAYARQHRLCDNQR